MFLCNESQPTSETVWVAPWNVQLSERIAIGANGRPSLTSRAKAAARITEISATSQKSCEDGSDTWPLPSAGLNKRHLSPAAARFSQDKGAPH